MFKKPKICVIGLGYVGLPLAISLSKYFSVTGFDTNPQRVCAQPITMGEKKTFRTAHERL